MQARIYPRLRRVELHNAEGALQLRDPLDGRTFLLAPHEALAVALLDGQCAAERIAARVSAQAGIAFRPDDLDALVERLSRACFLHDRRGQQHEERTQREVMNAPLRTATHAGAVYPASATACAEFVDHLLESTAGEKPAVQQVPFPPPVALLSPHIDYARGAGVYARLWAPLRGQLGEIDRVVILGTSHGGGDAPFLLSRKPFQTPLGTMPIANEIVAPLAEIAVPSWKTELLHRREHSVELQLPLLQRCLPAPDVPIVPLLCGSIHQSIHDRRRPEEFPDIRVAIEALREAVARVGGQTLWIAAGDLAHVGMHFGDAAAPLTDSRLEEVRRRDEELLAAAVRGDAAALTDHLLADGDARRICGYAPLWALLEAAQPQSGRVVAYAQAVDDRRTLAVSFAGIHFDR